MLKALAALSVALVLSIAGGPDLRAQGTQAPVQLVGSRVKLVPDPRLKPLPGSALLIDPGRMIVTVIDFSVADFENEAKLMAAPGWGQADGFREIVQSRTGAGVTLRVVARFFSKEGDGDFRKHIMILRDQKGGAGVIVAIPRAAYDADPASDGTVAAMLATVSLADVALAAPRGFKFNLPSGFTRFPPGAAAGPSQLFVTEGGDRLLLVTRLDKVASNQDFYTLARTSLTAALQGNFADVKLKPERREKRADLEFLEFEGTGTDAATKVPLAIIARLQRDPAGVAFICIGQGPVAAAEELAALYRRTFDSVVAE